MLTLPLVTAYLPDMERFHVFHVIADSWVSISEFIGGISLLVWSSISWFLFWFSVALIVVMIFDLCRTVYSRIGGGL